LRAYALCCKDHTKWQLHSNSCVTSFAWHTEMRQQSAAWDNLGLSLSSARNGENQLPHCHTGTIDAAWIAVKDLIPNSLCSKSKDLLPMWSAGSGDMWICIPISSKKQFQRWSACSEKKERTNMSTCSNEMNPKPTWNRNFAKFSRENLAQFGLQKCLLRYGENALKKKRCFYEHGSRRSAGMYIIFTYIYIYIYIYLYIHHFIQFSLSLSSIHHHYYCLYFMINYRYLLYYLVFYYT